VKFFASEIFCDFVQWLKGDEGLTLKLVSWNLIQNTRGEFEQKPHLRGGLQTDSVMVGLFFDYYPVLKITFFI